MPTNKKSLTAAKKIFCGIFFGVFIFSFWELVWKADVTYAAGVCGIGARAFCNPLSGTTTLAGAAIAILQYLLSIIGAIALFFLVFGGIKYMIAGGSQEKMTSAKNTLTSSAWGLAIALLAYTILSVIYKILNT